MRLVAVMFLLVACKGGDDGEPTSTAPAPAPAVKPSASAGGVLVPEEPLPAHFPLPASEGRTLVRAQSKLQMAVWEYEYTKLDAKAVAEKIEAGLENGYNIQSSSTDGDTRNVIATRDGRTYAIATRPERGATRVAIRSFPETGPTTLPAPKAYPTTFPFVAGGTASSEASGAQLHLAYQSDPKDIEIAMLLAAKAAGWTCSGAGTIACTKDKSNVTFSVEAAPGGSIVMVGAR